MVLTLMSFALRLYRTETCITASAAMGALSKSYSDLASNPSYSHITLNTGKQQDVSIDNMKEHITKHMKLGESSGVMAREIAVWAQHEGLISACDILKIPVPSLDVILDDPGIDVKNELFIDEGGCSLRPIKKCDVLDYVLESFPKSNHKARASAKRCVDQYADVYCKATYGITLE